jgi:hypothetical protein
MDGEFISIDPDIRNRVWGPISRNPARTPPPPESLVETSQLLSGGLSDGMIETRLFELVEFRNLHVEPCKHLHR